MHTEPLIRNLRIRLNVSEDHIVIYLANLFGEKNRSRIIRKMIREAGDAGPDLLKDDLSTVREGIRQFAAFGRNVNQITRAINSGQAAGLVVDSAMLKSVAELLKSIQNEFSQVVKRTQNRWVSHD